MSVFRSLTSGLIVLALGSSLSGQSLGDAAARERQKRRERGPVTAAAYSDEDLKGLRDGAATKAEEPPVNPSQSTGERSTAVTTGPSPEEQTWRSRTTQARQMVIEAEKELAAAEEEGSALRNDLNPLEGLQLPDRQQQLGRRLALANQRVEAAREGLARARKAVDEIEEEARRASVPPGWLRER